MERKSASSRSTLTGHFAEELVAAAESTVASAALPSRTLRNCGPGRGTYGPCRDSGHHATPGGMCRGGDRPWAQRHVSTMRCALLGLYGYRVVVDLQRIKVNLAISETTP